MSGPRGRPEPVTYLPPCRCSVYSRGEPSKLYKRFCIVEWSSLMRNERNGHRTAVVLFAVAVIIAIVAAFVTTLERVDTWTANNEAPSGTTGLAKPHPPLDRAPGQLVLGK